MAFTDFPEQTQGVALLQRSLERGRLGHAYLFSGPDLALLEGLARTLAKTLNCSAPRRAGAVGVDSCDHCSSCRRIDAETHPDLHWVRPESKLRVVKVEQMRDLMQAINLRPSEAEWKLGVVVAADRLTVQAANAFLKTLEEPPAKSILVLLSTEPSALIETILSRCLRLNFGGDTTPRLDAEAETWLRRFTQMAAVEQKSLMARYRLLGVVAARLAGIREAVEQLQTGRSPLTRYANQEVDRKVVEQWEKELAAAVEADYRHRRAGLLALLHTWLRDVWLHTLGATAGLVAYPQFAAEAQQVSARVSAREAMANLEVIAQAQRLLGTNVQESLALEVTLLKLRL
jgi:DNA polymerase-3 subunit delta'